VFRFPTVYTQAREFIQRSDRLARVQDALRKLTGKTWTVSIELDASAPVAVAGTPNGQANGSRPRTGAKEEAEKVPLIHRAVERLGATIYRVDEGFGDSAGPT
jgi:hypothetical protein